MSSTGAGVVSSNLIIFTGGSGLEFYAYHVVISREPSVALPSTSLEIDVIRPFVSHSQ